jgi:heme-degrading monooxygenase HmoA
MYVVIFRATIKQLDDEYSATAEKLRTLAFEEYGCRDFVAYTEGDEEVAISWWDSLEQIANWKNNPEHKAAQAKGRSHWYGKVSVQVLQTIKQY